MSAINIALLGFGTVGQGVYEMIQKHQNRLQFFLGKPVNIVAVLVKHKEKHLHLQDEHVLLTNDFEEIIGLPDLDIVIDAVVGIEPGLTYLKRSIEKGCHIVSANKELFALHGEELLSLAKEYKVSFGFEATVAGGIPVIQTLRKLLNINRVTKLEGILNGTSNFILTSMREEGLPFSQTLKIAQDHGYAEYDPTNDIEGFDAYYKALILSSVAFGAVPAKENTIRKGIAQISQEDIQIAASLGLKFKHIVNLEKDSNEIYCKVQPVLLSSAHPFYGVEGVQNAVSIDADVVGNICLLGPGAGKNPTASAIVEDLIHLYQEQIPACLEEDGKVSGEVRNKLGNWLILNWDLASSSLPQTFVEIDRLNEKVLFFKAAEEDIKMFVSEHPEAAIYPIEGEFFLSKEKVSA